MATPKIIGIETELGIIVRGDRTANPIAASSLLINAYMSGQKATAAVAPAVSWDFEDETPGLDARGTMDDTSLAPRVESNLVNAVLTNGARYYVDHAHPEISTPECADIRDVVVWDRAAEMIAVESMARANEVLAPGLEMVLHKNNSDRKGNTYGCHENYLLARETPFGDIASGITSHFVTRQLFGGAGKVGCEVPGVASSAIDYQLTQRADFFEEPIGLETTLKRPIINTRDEPHADAAKYRRLHVICGDANMSQVATFLKVGTSALLLAMIEDGALIRTYELADPVKAMQLVSYDTQLGQPLLLADGSTMTALEIQWELFDQARKYARDVGTACLGPSGDDVLLRWEHVLDGLEVDPDSLADQIDWIAKRRVLRGFMDRHGAAPDDPRIAALDLQYHDLRPQKSLAAKVGLVELVTDAEAQAAMTRPPETTRAFFRGECLRRFGDQIVSANWDSLVFDIGGESLRRIPMMEPTRGTKAGVGTLLESCADASELLERLGH